MRLPLRVCTVAGCALIAAACATPPPETETGGGPRTLVVETTAMPIDRIYRSMQGPWGMAPVDADRLDWVVSFRSEVVDARSGDLLGDEFFCHSQLQLPNSTRLMVAATGSEEIRFPEGFAMPVASILSALPESERSLGFLGMLLNNHRADADELALIRSTVEYYRDEDLDAPPRRLYKVGLPIAVEDLDAYELPPGEEMSGDETTHCVLVKGRNTHWIVPPGPQLTRTLYRDFLPEGIESATVHYAVAHLHNHGRYVSLTDLATGEVLWRTDVRYEPERVQIEEIPVFSSPAGFSVHRGREYLVEAFYDNTSGGDVDAMALIDLYYDPGREVLITYPEPPS